MMLSLLITKKSMEHKVECKKCDGNGYISWEVIMPQGFTRDIGYPDSETAECRDCAGYGWIPSHLVVDTED